MKIKGKPTAVNLIKLQHTSALQKRTSVQNAKQTLWPTYQYYVMFTFVNDLFLIKGQTLDVNINWNSSDSNLLHTLHHLTICSPDREISLLPKDHLRDSCFSRWSSWLSLERPGSWGSQVQSLASQKPSAGHCLWPATGSPFSIHVFPDRNPCPCTTWMHSQWLYLWDMRCLEIRAAPLTRLWNMQKFQTNVQSFQIPSLWHGCLKGERNGRILHSGKCGWHCLCAQHLWKSLFLSFYAFLIDIFLLL